MPISLECTIEAQPEYRLGEPITVTGTLRNTGQTGVWVLKWNTFFDGMRGNFVRVRFNETPVPYDGIYIRRGDPNAEKYLLIAPGESASATVNLCDAYPITAPGAYAASFALHLHDAFEETLEDPPRALNTHQSLDVASPSASFRVIAGGDPLPTKGERARARERRAAPESPAGGISAASPTPRTPVIVGADKDQTQEIMAAYTWAFQSIVKSVNSLQPEVSNGSAYSYWFGPTTYSQTVLANFQEMQTLMAVNQLKINLSDPEDECSWDIYAYVYGGTTIYICNLFFNLVFSSDSTRAQTIVHEVGHLAAGLQDIEYGEWGSNYLAATSPQQAILNADNYGYYALEVYPEPPPNNNGVWAKDSQLSGSTQGKPAVASSASAGSMILCWQDSNSSKNWLWYSEWNAAQNSWAKPVQMYNGATGLRCVTSAGPAIAAIEDFFYMMYIDGDPKSPTYQFLVYTSSSDNGLHWAVPQKVVTDLNPTKSPALIAATDGNLYCVYVSSDGYLCTISGAPSEEQISWGIPYSNGVQSDIEPCLGQYVDMLYCMYTSGDNAIQLLRAPLGGAWQLYGELPESQTQAAPALVQWNPANSTIPYLMCLYRGVDPDQNLHYTLYDGNLWTYQFRESGNKTKGGLALASYGYLLYSFHRGASSSNLWWSKTVSSPIQT
jgi:hypothetical protein